MIGGMDGSISLIAEEGLKRLFRYQNTAMSINIVILRRENFESCNGAIDVLKSSRISHE